MNKNKDEFPTPVRPYYLKKEELEEPTEETEHKIGWLYVEAIQQKALRDIQDEVGSEIIRILKNIIGVEPEVKCECGAEKCGTTHSDWCPKYE